MLIVRAACVTRPVMAVTGGGGLTMGGGLSSGGGGGGDAGKPPRGVRMMAALASASARVPSCRACLEAWPSTPMTYR